MTSADLDAMDGEGRTRTERTPHWGGGGRALAAALQGLRWTGAALRAFWGVARPALRWTLQVVLALLILLEEWGWRPLADLLGRLARWRPWARLETAIARLPPYAALIVFVLPSALLLPLKFLALFLIASGRFVLAGVLFAAAKVVATALVARLFMLTEPALLQIGWFAWLYDRFIPWKDALEDYVRSSYVWRVGRVWKARLRRMVRAQWRRWRPTMLEMRDAARAAARRLAAEFRRLVQEIRTRRAARRRAQ
jgi:hypothetical protein